MNFSDRIRHWFHVVSNVRPLVWLCSYILLIPLFALLYWWLPVDQWRIPDGAGTDYGSWFYYSIVTITTLGFGDYTPAHGAAQAVTAIEVGCGISILGFFLNAVGSMKSETDVTAAIEKQRALHKAQQTDRLHGLTPSVVHVLNTFLTWCYAVTTPKDKRSQRHQYDPDFNFSDMAEMYHPSGLDSDLSGSSAIDGLVKSSFRASICLDSLQTRVDLELWPDILEKCFTFVANCQMFTSADHLTLMSDRDRGGVPHGETAALAKKIASINGVPDKTSAPQLAPEIDLYHFIRQNARLAEEIEAELSAVSLQ